MADEPAPATDDENAGRFFLARPTFYDNDTPAVKRLARCGFWAYCDFLQRNGLTVRTIVTDDGVLDDERPRMYLDDLTELGHQFFRATYPKWSSDILMRNEVHSRAWLKQRLEKVRAKFPDLAD